MQPATTRSERGQALIITAVFMSVFFLFAYFLFNVLGYQTLGSRAAESALRAGGLAALDDRVPTGDEYGRWYIDPAATDATVRAFALENLSAYEALIDGDLETIVNQTTDDGSQYGLDIEVLNPAAAPQQLSSDTVNGVPTTVDVCSDPNQYPESIRSTLDPDQCADSAAIIMRLRIPVRQMGTGNATIQQVVIMEAGTDD